jgi:hypothetical protein
MTIDLPQWGNGIEFPYSYSLSDWTDSERHRDRAFISLFPVRAVENAPNFAYTS